MNGKIAIAENEREILDCYEVMAELRPHIERSAFVPLVRRLSKIAGFQLVYLSEDGIKAIAGDPRISV